MNADGRVDGVIIRMWKGKVKIGMATDYRRHLQATVFPQLRKLPGFLGAQLLDRDQTDKLAGMLVHFVGFLLLSSVRAMAAAPLPESEPPTVTRPRPGGSFG